MNKLGAWRSGERASILRIVRASLAVLVTAFLAAGPARAATTTDIVSVSSGMCVDLAGTSVQAGGAVVQTPCSTDGGAEWTVQPLGNGNYHLVNRHSGMCLNVPGASRAAGTGLIQWPCQRLSAQNDQWKITPVALSTYQIVSAQNGQCVNINGNSKSPGAKVIQWPCQLATQYNDKFMLDVPGLAPGELVSSWSDVIDLPITPVGIANLPNNQLLMWAADSPVSFGSDKGYGYGQTYTSVFDVASNAAGPSQVTTSGSNLFCTGTAVLANGNVLVAGGDSSPKTQVYDWRKGQWAAVGNMNVPRGYQGNTPLSDGNVFTLGGSWSGGTNARTSPNRAGEVWNAATGAWTLLNGVPETNVIGPDPQDVSRVYRGDNHLWLIAAGNGSVFHAGPSAAMNWIDTRADGAIVPAGTRGTDAYSINGNAVLYDIGKILKVGGAPAYQQPASGVVMASSAAYQIDISGGPTAPVVVTALAPMSYRRAFSNAVVLPSGEVVVVGGQTVPQPFTDSFAVLVPELWSPVTQTFRPLAPMQTPRTYHSTAILLQDGRVFVGGGGLCGVGCPQNHTNAEILTPPYLLNPDGSPAPRPRIVSAPAQASLGSSVAVATAQPVKAFALVRLSSTTHTVNNDQRRVPLTITAAAPGAGTGTVYSLQIPADSGVVLPGYYMLFALDANGVPSVSTLIALQ